MRARPLPEHVVRVRKLDGTPHSAYDLFVDGRLIRSQLGRYSDAEREALVREHGLGVPTASAYGSDE